MSCVIGMSFCFNFVPLSARLSAFSMPSTLWCDSTHIIVTNPLTLLLWIIISLVQSWQSLQLSFFRTACTGRLSVQMTVVSAGCNSIHYSALSMAIPSAPKEEQIFPATKLSLSSIAIFLSSMNIPAPPLSIMFLVDPSVQMTNSTSWLLLLPGCYWDFWAKARIKYIIIVWIFVAFNEKAVKDC